MNKSKSSKIVKEKVYEKEKDVVELEQEPEPEILYRNKGNWFMVFFNTAIALAFLYVAYMTFISIKESNDYLKLFFKIIDFLMRFL